MATVSELQSLLSSYAGSGNTFLTRLNLVRARLFPYGNWRGLKEQMVLTVYADADGNSIVTLPYNGNTLLAGAVRDACDLRFGRAMGVQDGTLDFSKAGPGYGVLGNDFREVPGRFVVWQEWAGSLFLRFKFEATESAGVIHLKGKLAGDDVWSLYSATWISGEKVAFTGSATVTSTKKFDAIGLSAVKPVTNGRVSVWTVDDDGVETQVGSWEPGETVPRRRRYKVVTCADATTTTSTTPSIPGQYYTKTEVDNLFQGDIGSIAVSSAGTHDLDHAAYFLGFVKIMAAAGSGTYTHKFTLDTSKPKTDAIFIVRLEIVASANPTIEFYDESTGGTLLLSVAGDSDNALYQTIRFWFDGAAWHLLA